MAPSKTSAASPERAEPGHDRPDVFVSYAREDKEFVEGSLMRALAAHDKDVWIDVEDIRGGASDWRASAWAGIEAAKVVVFVLTPDSLASEVCGEELERSEELNKRIIPVLRRSVDGLLLPPALARPNWILARAEDDADTTFGSLIDAIELDEAWVEQHARLTQRTGEWLRHSRDGSYLLRGSDLRAAERWLDDQGQHREAPTADQITYITASRRAAARRQRGLLSAAGLALAITAVLAVVALVQWRTAVDRERTARAQARAAQSIAALSRDPEESLKDALEAVAIRPDLPEAKYALRRAVSLAGWTRLLRPGPRESSLQDVEFSEDGTRVATAGDDHRVSVWDTNTGRRTAVVRTPGPVRTVQFSPSGRHLLTASAGGGVRTWDSATGRHLRTFETGAKDARSATWSDDGRRILTATSRGGDVWNAADPQPLGHLRNVGSPGAIRMSLDGMRALTAGTNGAAWLWDLATPQQKQPTTLPGPNRHDPVQFSLLSADGRRLAAIYVSGTHCVWDDGRPGSRRCVRSEAGSTDGDLSRDGRRVLRVDPNGVVRVWDAASKSPTPIATLPNGGSVGSAQFDRSGEYVVTGGDGGFARIWRVKPKELVALLHGHTRGVRRARFSPEGEQVATVSDDGTARLWPARRDTPIDPAWQSAESTSFSPNSRDVLVIRGQRRAIWNTDTGGVVELEGGGVAMTGSVTWPCGRAAGCSPWSPGRTPRSVAGSNERGGAVIWDPDTGRVSHRVGKETGTVREVAFSPDGRRIVVVDGERRRARVWNVSTGKPKPEREVPGGSGAPAELFSAQFVANPVRVLTVDKIGNVQITDLRTGKTESLEGKALPAAVAAARKGGRIAIGTTDGRLRIASGAATAPRPRVVTDKAVSSLEFSRGGGAIVTGGQSGTAIVWHGRRLLPRPLRAFGGEISGATFGPRGDLVLVTSGATARLWDLTLGRVVVELPRTAGVRAEFSPDGRKIVIAGATRLEGVPCLACLSLGELERRARALLPAS